MCLSKFTCKKHNSVPIQAYIKLLALHVLKSLLAQSVLLFYFIFIFVFLNEIVHFGIVSITFRLPDGF